jgi:hypothetical protein
MTSRVSTWLWSAMSVISMSAQASCADRPGAHSAGPQAPGSSPSAPGSETTRGMNVEQGRLAFQRSLQARRSRDAVPHELHDGDTVMTGDRIRATIATSEDAYLYLAFCAEHKLTIYPTQRGVHTAAGSPKLVPEGNSELVLDGDPGPEILYLIVSRTELSLADPRLSAKLAAAGQDGKSVDCTASLDAEFARPAHQDGSAMVAASSPKTTVLRGRLVPNKRSLARHARAGHPPRVPTASGSGSSSDHDRPRPVDADTSTTRPDDPDFIRNPGTIVWYGPDGAGGSQDVVASDSEGIAVVRYRFAHVDPPAQP